MSIGSFNKQKYTVLLAIVFASVFLVYINPAHADILLPGDITTCGELSVSGTYNLAGDITVPANTSCFTVSSDNVIIDGQGIYSIQGSSTNLPAIDARKYSNGSLVEGANGYTLIITGLTISGYTTLVDASGNSDTTGSGQNSGYGGNGGSVSISYSTTTASNFISNGGAATTKTNGGDGGNIVFTDQNLDVSNKDISVIGGMGTGGRGSPGGLTFTYTGSINKSQLTASDLSFLNVNGTTTTDFYNWTVATSSPITTWQSITSSADGSRLAATAATTVSGNGQIYISTDFGVTWTIRGPSRSWSSIAWSSDGSKLVATSLGYTFVSSDFGLTWQQASNVFGSWYYAASSIDGIRLVAILFSGNIYTSSDSGITWVSRGSSGIWRGLVSSADGSKLAAIGSNYIYTSSDYGQTWTARDSNRVWRSITSSADGTKLAAAVNNGQIYTSTDSGVKWTVSTTSPIKFWQSIASSASGTKLAAVESNGQIYTSTDSGLTWTARDSSRNWWSITSSSDGTKLAAVVNGGQIYTSEHYLQTYLQPINIDVLLPQIGTNTIWSPYISWGTATTCQFSIDGGAASTTPCFENGVSIPRPTYGTHTLVVTGTDANNVTVSKTVTFTMSLPLSILLPQVNSSYSSTTWNPSVSWNYLGYNDLTSCSYSYDNWVSSTTVDCTKNGAGILPPSVVGTSTLYIRVTSASEGVGINSSTFNYSTLSQTLNIFSPVRSGSYLPTTWAPIIQWGISNLCQYSYDNWVSSSTVNCDNNGYDVQVPLVDGSVTLYVRSTDISNTITNASTTFTYSSWVARESVRAWKSVASSANGTKLVAVSSGGRIYVSIDSGVTWTARESSRSWYSITSSADGTKLAAVVYGGQIYTSTDSGVTWTARDFSRQWNRIASSADGTKLAAVVYDGQIYTSTDSGLTWTARDSRRLWQSITSSADGTRLVAVGGFIYTSTDSGVTWTARESNRIWTSVASSADGTKLAAVVGNGQIYTSINSGLNWTARDSPRNWFSITSSADGTKLAAVVGGSYTGQIYTSTDSGVTWNISSLALIMA
ncbi:MAG: hypothetical protein WCP09_03415, partial [Candidatus Taylorbacteria bacterium]